MKTLEEVRHEKKHAFTTVQDLVGLRPNAVGIIYLEGGAPALKITLPRDPGFDPPTEINGVHIQWHVSVSTPTLLTGSDDETPEWLKRSQQRREVARLTKLHNS